MYEKLEFCPICKNTKFINHLISTDHSISGESFALNKCSKCELIFTNPRPDQNAISKYYHSEDYISHANKSNSLINTVYKIVRNHTIKQKVKLINKYHKKGTILDFGCGTGEFLQACKKNKWKTYGYEPEPIARNQAAQKGLEIVGDIKTVKEKFDIITAWHVIEHVPDLKKTVKSLKKQLNKDGVIFIAVPNVSSHDAKHYQEYWAGYDVPRHFYHFTQESFGKLIAKTKLKLIDTLPMVFDSYYVSLLSEKYKNGKSNPLKAIKVGYDSNQQAKKTSEYSSLIYVLKK